MGLQKLRIPVRRSVPSFILHKGIITPEVHGHGSAADWTAWNQLPRNRLFPVGLIRDLIVVSVLFQESLGHQHFHHGVPIVVCLLVAWFGTLKKSIIALCVEKPGFIKTSPLKAVVYIGGQDKVILSLQHTQQFLVNRDWRHHVTVDINKAAEIPPIFLQCSKWEKHAGIHIVKAIGLFKV